MKVFFCFHGSKGISLIDLVITSAIVSIVAMLAVSAYASHRLRANRLNGQACLLNLARQQEAYFSRKNRYVTDLKILGYRQSKAAECPNTDLYRLTSELPDADNCPLSRCYRLRAMPQGAQIPDGALYLSYDSSQADTGQRLRKERGKPGSGIPWP